MSRNQIRRFKPVRFTGRFFAVAVRTGSGCPIGPPVLILPEDGGAGERSPPGSGKTTKGRGTRNQKLSEKAHEKPGFSEKPGF
jgi:hypothetical protein